ncbi:hypothetical protein DUE52_22490 [Larkinella punicea]|uniref:Uncharacterized protein n=1 Tax=Larkinella punicea TaxID=2315727 RepID=A0A368JL71_9BACT|nr:hypothetical protein DUE52_22490 [Larkinella punicea]
MAIFQRIPTGRVSKYGQFTSRNGHVVTLTASDRRYGRRPCQRLQRRDDRKPSKTPNAIAQTKKPETRQFPAFYFQGHF